RSCNLAALDYFQGSWTERAHVGSLGSMCALSGLRRQSFGLAMRHVATRPPPAVHDRCLWKYRSGYRTRTSTNSDHENRRWLLPAFNPRPLTPKDLRTRPSGPDLWTVGHLLLLHVVERGCLCQGHDQLNAKLVTLTSGN